MRTMWNHQIACEIIGFDAYANVDEYAVIC